MISSTVHRALAAGAAILVLNALLVVPAQGHERRDVGDFEMVVGFIGEPVYTGQKSGLEFLVTDHDGQPVTGLAETLQAEVVFAGQQRELPLSPRFGAEGWYQSVFFPTAAGAYTFRIHGTIDDQQVDESFTSGPDTFDEVQEATAGQFPTVLPSATELADQAARGAEAAEQAMLALIVGGAGVVLGLVGIGLALAARRRSA